MAISIMVTRVVSLMDRRIVAFETLSMEIVSAGRPASGPKRLSVSLLHTLASSRPVTDQLSGGFRDGACIVRGRMECDASGGLRGLVPHVAGAYRCTFNVRAALAS